MMLDEERVRRAIAEAFPAIEAASAAYFAAGWDYELWQVNDDLLVRFPLREECAAPLLVEARLLRALASRVSLRIPQPEHVSTGCPSFPMPFFTYRKIAGLPLGDVSLNDRAARDIAKEIGRFLSQVHSFPPQRAVELGVPSHSTEAWRDRYRRMQARVREHVQSHLSPAAAEDVEAFWHEFLGNDRYFTFEPRLIHADLDTAHVLVDASGTKITGIIDFGDARVGDPALDFAGYPEMKDAFDSPFREAVLAGYDLPVDETFLQRADIYRRRISPFHAVIYGLELDNEAWLQKGLQAIELEARRKKHK